MALHGTFSRTIPSSPIPSTYASYPLDMDDWTCAQWKAYYQNNVKAVGKDKALQIVDVDSENVGVFATVNTCLYDCEWVKYFQDQGLKSSNLFSKVYCATNSVVTSAANTVANSAGVVENVTGAAKSFSSSKILLIGGGLLLLFGAYKLATNENVTKNLKYAL